jgi:hypothetical protein
VIRYYHHKEINKRLWDECISSSVNGRIYAYSWYLDIVADNWNALILDDYKAVFPLPFRRKFGVDYIYQPVFTQQLGLFSKVPLKPSLLDEFLTQIPSQYKFVDINLNQHNRLNSLNIKAESRQNIEMDLIDEYEFIKEGYSNNLRRNLKNAAKAKLTIFENLKPDAVIRLFQSNKGKQLDVYSTEDYSRLIRTVYKALQLGQAEVWGAYSSENNLCAAAIFLRSNKRVTFLFSGSNNFARQNGALPYLIDAYIEANAGQELVFDFEGSNDDNLARFYLGFGSKSIAYKQIKWVRSSFILKYFFYIYLRIR